ncbi:MAG: hypothetical protein NZZ41_02590 [Candidatus Dojkabacteria bacterium]|nr:hypothetical protein [Candidatus Dojkabacteria bacterium]
MLKSLVSIIVLLLFSTASYSQVYKVRIIDEPLDEYYYLIMSYDGNNSYNLKLTTSGIVKTVFSGLFNYISTTKSSKNVITNHYNSISKITVDTGEGYEYPYFVMLMTKSYEERGVQVTHFIFTFLYEREHKILIKTLNLVSGK